MWQDQIIAKRYVDINNNNELQTRQGMDSRYMQKSTVLTNKYWENTQLGIKIVIDNSLKCSVNKVYMYWILVVSIYAFLINMALLIQLSSKQIPFLSHWKGYNKLQILTVVWL